MSLKAVRGHRGHRKKTRGSRELNIKEEDEGKEENEWVAEPEPGVLINLVTLSNGCNRLKKIRFSEERFDALGAQRWWSNNYEKILELYTINSETQPVTPPQSDDECQNDQVEANSDNELPKSPASSNTTHRKLEEGCSTSTNKSRVISEKDTNDNNIDGTITNQEMVVEDEPGVFVTIRSTPEGSKELLRVELSRERFGEVRARVWWEENKARLQKQYS